MEEENQTTKAVVNTFDENAWKVKREAQEKVAVHIAQCLDIIFNAEKEMKTKNGYHFVNTEYFISKQEGSYIFFAKFKINKGLATIERTFLFDIWHSFTGFEESKEDLQSEVKRFLESVKYIN